MSAQGLQSNDRRIGPAIRAAAFVILYAHFFALAADGLRSGFMPDDMMNLYGSWSKPPGRLFLDLVLVFFGAYRPAGALFYVPLFAAFGFDPLPFRIVCVILLALNLFLALAVVRRLSGSFEVAVFSALLFSYHAHFADLYYSSGTIYDLLAFLSFYSCLLWYVSIRRRGGVPDFLRCAGMGALFWLALGSKEIAATLPVILLLYECTYGESPLSFRRSWLGWLVGPGRCIALFGALSAAYIAPRMIGPGAMTWNPSYSPVVSFGVYLDNLHHYIGLLLYRPGQVSGRAALAGCAATLALAFLLKNRNLIFSWALFMVGSLPIMFIPARGPFVLYVPYLGMTMYLAVALAVVARPLVERLRRHVRLPPDRRGLPFLAGLGAAALILYVLHAARKTGAAGWVGPEQAKVRQVVDVVSAKHKTVRKGARVLLLDAPFADDDWAPASILRLYHRDPSLRVEWRRSEGSLRPEVAAQYDAVVEFPAQRRD